MLDGLFGLVFRQFLWKLDQLKLISSVNLTDIVRILLVLPCDSKLSITGSPTEFADEAFLVAQDDGVGPGFGPTSRGSILNRHRGR